MNEFDQNEVAALTERWKSEDSQESPVRMQIADGTVIAGSAVAIGTALVAQGGSAGVGLAIAGGGVAGLNLFEWFLKLGDSTVKENVRELADAVCSGFARLEKKCIETGKGVDELKARLDSAEFTEATAILVLQSLRTKNKRKLDRLALVLVNGVAENDLEPERFDDMMRAAVELTDWDITVLGKMYDSQKNILSDRRASHDWSEQVGHIWTDWNRIFGLGEDQHLKVRSALSRLQSLGLVAEAQTNFVKDGSLARQAFGLLPDGAKLFLRLQEIAAGD
ncbi:MAG: hypothetical protein ACRD3N_06035 [Terracidiphilus sp.]